MSKTSGPEDIQREATDLAIDLTANEDAGYDALLEMVGNARFVLLGEASHGTHEFYVERARITKRLIREGGFNLIAIEGDWPEAYAVNRYVLGASATAEEALLSFGQFPRWMWANEVMGDFLTRLRKRNDACSSPEDKVQFLGLDVYSPHRSLALAAEIVSSQDPSLADEARRLTARYDPPLQCDRDAFDTGIDPGFLQAVDAMEELSRRIAVGGGARGLSDPNFIVRQSLEFARAGAAYSAIFHNDGPEGWNLRDTAMTDALDAIMEQAESGTKVVVWQHNAHIGDFRATSDNGGRHNLGQLVRQRHPGESVAVGFGTYEGTVTAAPGWGRESESLRVSSARMGSYDEVFHRLGLGKFLLLLRDLPVNSSLFAEADHRAVGAVHDPDKEDDGYSPTSLAARYDAYVHIDRSSAVRPLI